MLEPIKVLLSSNPIRAYTVIIGLILSLCPLIYSAIKDIKEQAVVVYQLLIYDGLALLFNIIIACMSNRGIGYIIAAIMAVPITILFLYINNEKNSDLGIGKGDIDLLSPLVSIILCDIIYFIVDSLPKSFNFLDNTVTIFILALLVLIALRMLINADISSIKFDSTVLPESTNTIRPLVLYYVALLFVVLAMLSTGLRYVHIALQISSVLIIFTFILVLMGISNIHYMSNMIMYGIILSFILYMFNKGLFNFGWTSISIYLISTFVFYMLLGMIGGIIVWFIWFLYQRIRGRVKFRDLMYDTKIPMIPMLIIPCIMTLYTIYVL